MADLNDKANIIKVLQQIIGVVVFVLCQSYELGFGNGRNKNIAGNVTVHAFPLIITPAVLISTLFGSDSKRGFLEMVLHIIGTVLFVIIGIFLIDVYIGDGLDSGTSRAGAASGILSLLLAGLYGFDAFKAYNG